MSACEYQSLEVLSDERTFWNETDHNFHQCHCYYSLVECSAYLNQYHHWKHLMVQTELNYLSHPELFYLCSVSDVLLVFVS